MGCKYYGFRLFAVWDQEKDITKQKRRVKGAVVAMTASSSSVRDYFLILHIMCGITCYNSQNV